MIFFSFFSTNLAKLLSYYKRLCTFAIYFSSPLFFFSFGILPALKDLRKSTTLPKKFRIKDFHTDILLQGTGLYQCHAFSSPVLHRIKCSLIFCLYTQSQQTGNNNILFSAVGLSLFKKIFQIAPLVLELKDLICISYATTSSMWGFSQFFQHLSLSKHAKIFTVEP